MRERGKERELEIEREEREREREKVCRRVTAAGEETGVKGVKGVAISVAFATGGGGEAERWRDGAGASRRVVVEAAGGRASWVMAATAGEGGSGLRARPFEG